MAGSLEMMWHDVKDIDGDFTSQYCLIENLGDAYEACEEAIARIELLERNLKVEMEARNRFYREVIERDVIINSLKRRLNRQ